MDPSEVLTVLPPPRAWKTRFLKQILLLCFCGQRGAELGWRTPHLSVLNLIRFLSACPGLSSHLRIISQPFLSQKVGSKR